MLSKEMLLNEINRLYTPLPKKQELAPIDSHKYARTGGQISVLNNIRMKVESGKFDTFKVRDEVKWFAEKMEHTLKQNDHKGGWNESDERWLLKRVLDEAQELDFEICRSTPDPEKIIREATDVANFAMMIADKARKMMNTV